MLFSSPDYPVFLIAVFFLYALARWGGPRMAWARLAVMVLLGDVVFMLVAKDLDAVWDPIGGFLLREATHHDDYAWWMIERWAVGAALLASAVAIGRRYGTWIASDRGQKLIAIGFVSALAAVGLTVWIGSHHHALDAITIELADHGHLLVLFVLGIGFGASMQHTTRVLGRVMILFVVSALFYHAWAAAMPGAYRYLLALLLATIALDYYLGLWIERTETPWKRKALVIVSLCSNLGILVFFKYADFFVQDVLQLHQYEELNLILPAGISFHTFQSLSYTIDVYRKELPATRSVVDFATFVLFFPQLVAGPIVRAKELLPQLSNLPPLELQKATDGLFRIVVGLFKKITLADALALYLVDRVFEAPEHFSSLEVLCGVYAYALQIYLDFSAYSDIAIGSAQILGFELPENFRTPYRSANLQEFWRRWHISLSSWLRDYLYITLGGSKGAAWRTYVNLILTMLLGGLWHGASWAFIVWGALHGFGLAITRYFQRATADDPYAAWRMFAVCSAVAAVGLTVLRLGLGDSDTWYQLVIAWLTLTPVWAVLTAWLGKDPAPTRTKAAPAAKIVVEGFPYRELFTGAHDVRAIDRVTFAVEALRIVMCGASIVFVARLDADSNTLWIPLVLWTCGLGLAADLFKRGFAQLSRSALAAEALRIAMCVAGVGFLIALRYAPSSTWIPLVVLAWLLAIAADLVERGFERWEDRLATALKRGIAIVLVFHYVCLAWVFFRATSFDNALAVLRQIADGSTDHPNLVSLVTIALATGFLCHFFADGSFRWLRERFMAMPVYVQGSLLAVAALVLRALSHHGIVPFIYFQF
ncbi:MAG TPA: MBOAT family O-acyltransferase [Kofleriaceae bacterium]|nr:MBOAT family O-acyltransferase [Kofleriaceae bacterium]